VKAVALVALAACAGPAVFRLSSDDNNRYELGKALARRQLPDHLEPVNRAHQPRVFADVAGKAIVAFDLAGMHALWKADADVSSRIAVGGDFIIDLEGKQLVARDQASGSVRWRASVPGTFTGATADRDRAYLTYRDGTRAWLVGFDGASGKQLWKDDADGKLGAPVAQGGIVYVPYFDQWLGIVDGASGAMLTRILGVDEQITMLQATSQVVYYGAKQGGVHRLELSSYTGKRDGAFVTVTVPHELEHTSYGRDIYEPVELGYSATDRTRLLYTSEPTAHGPLALTGDGYAVHYFRFLFGFATDGTLRWAYSQPRVELVASAHLGTVIAAVSIAGDIVAVDPATGAVRATGSLGTQGTIVGATFDADGWTPSTIAAPTETAKALVTIALDHDARFDRVKELAVASLAKLPGADVTRELLAVLADPRAPDRLKDSVAELLVTRKDPDSLPVLTGQLAVHDDYLANTTSDALGPVAKAIAGLAGVKLDPAQVATTITALAGHLDAPGTSLPDLVAVIDAMAAIGGGTERSALASHLLLYHADDEIGADAAWAKAIVSALRPDRELLRKVAADPRTAASLTAAIGDAAHE
jgi:outer membrane protein assembly factor BamB